MKHDRDPLEHEQELLAHFRAHGGGEPSAEMDARILAAASAAARESVRQAADEPGAGLAQRLHRWLFGSGRQRWSVALAGLACVGIGVSLTWRTLERSPDAFDTVPPAAVRAPAREALSRQYAAPAAPAPAERKKEAPALRMQAAPAASMADTAVEESAAPAKAEPRDNLLRLLGLRRAGEEEKAQRLFEQLRAEHPQLDIEAELGRLEDESDR
ncbi:hypothetical protein ACUTAF_07100 [Pseudomonas sp. SP16.1]|uniref:hypothetical protein n=1 Tax=Pseudomonas sp. SP16.1 TaxID=3458854 RepID=UPI004045CEC2